MVLIAHLLIVVRQAPKLVAANGPGLGLNGNCLYNIVEMIIFVLVSCVI